MPAEEPWRIITKDLQIINAEIIILSTESNIERSWIGLTLCNSKLTQNIRRWTCGEEETCPDISKYFSTQNQGASKETPNISFGSATIQK